MIFAWYTKNQVVAKISLNFVVGSDQFTYAKNWGNPSRGFEFTKARLAAETKVTNPKTHDPLLCLRYWSDFKDAFASQTIASIIYIYLATITKAITFGGFLGDITDGLQGVLEAFLGHALAGGFFCLFGGQPLTVLGCTGPVLIFEKILVDCCKEYELDYMTFRHENKTHQCTIFDTKASL